MNQIKDSFLISFFFLASSPVLRLPSLVRTPVVCQQKYMLNNYINCIRTLYLCDSSALSLHAVLAVIVELGKYIKLQLSEST